MPEVRSKEEVEIDEVGGKTLMIPHRMAHQTWCKQLD